MQEDPLWDRLKVAEYTDIPAGTLEQWRHRGIGPRGFRLGRHVRYRRSEVERWLRECEDAEQAGAA